MSTRVSVLGGVPIGRAVAAADLSADHALAQVDPACADLQALRAPLGAGWTDFQVDLIEVRAGGHVSESTAGLKSLVPSP